MDVLRVQVKKNRNKQPKTHELSTEKIHSTEKKDGLAVLWVEKSVSAILQHKVLYSTFLDMFKYIFLMYVF